MSGSARFKPYKTPFVHRSVHRSKYITTTRRPAPSEPGQPNRPSMLVSAPRRMTKAKLAALSERDRAREEAAIQSKLTRKQLAELDVLRCQLAEGGDIPSESLYNTAEIDYFDAENDVLGSDDGWDDEDSEVAVVNELGLGDSGNTEWRNRLKTEHDAWEEQLPMLCDAYLAFLGGMKPKGDLGDSQVREQVKVRCISFWSDEIKVLYVEDNVDYTNIALVQHGFISPSPTRPNLAISLKVLDVFAAVQQRCPSASVQGLARSLCDLRNVPYKSYFRTQLSKVLDVYHAIQRKAQKLLNKLEGEPQLLYSMLATCDGNDSLKRCTRAGKADKRIYKSDYYISRDEVNRFEGEVEGKKKGKQEPKDSEETGCEERWRNASADKRPDKKTKAYFEETGIFVSLCRHSFVLTICDMVKSGEKAKYALATIDRLISVFGPKILMGYDIGCTTKKTVARSSLLGPKAAKQRFEMCVGSFHGAAHNRACQLQNHPHNRLGAGLSDLENAETFFSSSNRIAATTRLTSCFRRHQRIDILIETWNNDMYESLGSLLRRKYVSAIKTINSTTKFLSHSSNTTAKIEGYFADEQKYLSSLKQELPEDSFKIHYVELLEQLEVKEDEFNSCLNATPSTAEQSNMHRLLFFKSRIEAKRRAVLEQLTSLQQAIQKVEEEHGITRWTRENNEWKEAQKLRSKRHFHSCVDSLERLIIQRLLELSRAGLANTGYKLRQQISRSVASRSGAVKTALDRYNKAATELS